LAPSGDVSAIAARHSREASSNRERRPHPVLGYRPRAAFAAILTATGDRNPDQLRRSPVAPPARRAILR